MRPQRPVPFLHCTQKRLVRLALIGLSAWGTCGAGELADAAVAYRQNEMGLERGAAVAIPGLVRTDDAAVVVEFQNGRVVRLAPHSAAFFAPSEEDSIRMTVGSGVVEVRNGPHDLAKAGARSVIVLAPRDSGPESPWDFIEDPTTASGPLDASEAEEDRDQRPSRRPATRSGEREKSRL